MKQAIDTADLFAGAGGFSTGLVNACKRLGIVLRTHTVVNHWDTAVNTHRANHSFARHLCASLSMVFPCNATPAKRLRVLLAAPECTNHSSAHNGPINDQSRASAWEILRWLQELYVDDFIMENVPAFMRWGPLGADGRPLKSRRGETFKAFIHAIESLGYRVEWRVLNAADFGDATERERLIIRARRKRLGQIEWPKPTHEGRWKPASEIIDWTLPGKSIFNRPKPLQPATLDRIEMGIRRFWGEWAEPFIVILRNNCKPQSIHEPIGTVCASGGHFGLVHAPDSFVIRHAQTSNKDRLRSLERPMPTLTASREFSLVQPLFMGHAQTSNKGRQWEVSSPMPTLTTADKFALVRPFWLNYYSNGVVGSIDQPLRTITTRDRFALVQGRVKPHDILYRMFQPHELSAAMGFPKDYIFHGNREDTVRQIGNAIPVGLAEAMCFSTLAA